MYIRYYRERIPRPLVVVGRYTIHVHANKGNDLLGWLSGGVNDNKVAPTRAINCRVKEEV